jgi:hypothetical protein
MKGNGSQLAKLTGFTKAHISKSEKKGVIKRDENGFFDLIISSKALGRPIKLPEKTKEPIDFAEWRNVKMKEDALIAKRERQIIEGDLLDRDAVLQEVGRAFHAAKTKILAMPVSIAGIVATESDATICKEIIEGHCREALAEIGSTISRLGASGNNEAAAAANG